MKAQESFRHDPEVQVLLATDAAGEGINLQRAHLMVNYDLPWNPNRIEQRFGRIHRIGQTEVCHLWNLVAEETREGEVYRMLLEKLNEARKALGGQVFDVLGKLQFEGKPLRELLIEAVRYGEQPDVRARLTQVVVNAFDRGQLQDLLEERALAHDAMDASRVHRIREDMERAEARRLQPHYIESFFLEAFQRLGGTAKQREPRRYEVTHVPAPVRNRDRLIGIGEPSCLATSASPSRSRWFRLRACRSPPLFAQAIRCSTPRSTLPLERHRDLLRRGTVLWTTRSGTTASRHEPLSKHASRMRRSRPPGHGAVRQSHRMLPRRRLYQAGSRLATFTTRLISTTGRSRADEPNVEVLLARPECAWISRELEQKAQGHAVAQVVPEHLSEVRSRKLELIAKTEAAVKDRLTKEINYWDHRAEQLKLQEQAGKPNARLNSGEARKRADALQARLEKRMEELKLEGQISPLPPVVLGGLLVVPAGLIALMTGRPLATRAVSADHQAAAARARAIVMEVERSLGFEPTDREFEKLGYDIESRVPGTGKLRFIEVKGRDASADTITVTRNEILYSLNKPDDFILAIVEFQDDGTHHAHYLRQPFRREPDFGVTSVNYDFAELLASG